MLLEAMIRPLLSMISEAIREEEEMEMLLLQTSDVNQASP